MAITFGDLGKTMVHVGISGGRYIEVKMLSVADFAAAQDVMRGLSALNERKDVGDSARIDAVIDARKKLVETARKVMPEELMDGVSRMELMDVWKLVAVLGTGKDDGEDDDPQKKITYPSQTAVNP